MKKGGRVGCNFSETEGRGGWEGGREGGRVGKRDCPLTCAERSTRDACALFLHQWWFCNS